MPRLLAGVLLLSLAGCQPKVTAIRLGEIYPERAPAAEVQIYSANLPACAFEEIALISVRPQVRLGKTDREQMLRALRERASELGGDAVVGLRLLQAEQDSGFRDGVQGTVIRYKGTGQCTTTTNLPADTPFHRSA